MTLLIFFREDDVCCFFSWLIPTDVGFGDKF